MVRNIGRVLLLIVSLVMIGFAIPDIINAVTFFNGVGWANMFASNETIAIFASMLSAGITIIVALPALLAAILGRIGFWGFIFALLYGAGVVFKFVSAHQAGLLPDAQAVFSMIYALIFPIFYALGIILLFVGKVIGK